MSLRQKTIYASAACLLLSGVSSASPFWFSLKAGAGSGSAVAGDLIVNDGHVITNLNAAELTRTNAGNDLLYSIVWMGIYLSNLPMLGTVSNRGRIPNYWDRRVFYFETIDA